MCRWCSKCSTYELQNVGAGGNSNYFYATVRAWAPSADVTSCRKGDPAHYDRDFGEQEVVYTDAESGRVYADFWIPIARTDDNGATWVEYGDLSVGNKIIGWNWMIEWYVGDKLLCTGSTRLSLVNTKEQLYSHKDWYIGGIEDKITANTDKLTAQEEKLTAQEQAINKVTAKVNTIEESIQEVETSMTWGFWMRFFTLRDGLTAGRNIRTLLKKCWPNWKQGFPEKKLTVF